MAELRNLSIVFLVLSLFVASSISVSIHETLTLRKKMRNLMERELGKGRLNSTMQELYLRELQDLSDYAFLTRKDYKDDRLFTPVVYKPTPQPTLPAPKCPGSRDCPLNRKLTRNDAVTSRARQCAKFNGTSFNGYFFFWVPYLRVADSKECELNCLAKGHRFFLRLLPKVKDGTPCLSDPSKLCIDGKCQVAPIGCENGICFTAAFKRPKHKIFGLFTSKKSSGKLVLGYNAVITIPKGSTNINITEMQPSKNYLALKAHNSNKYFLNGDWVIDLPRGYKIAGTKFYYKRPKRNQRFNEAIVSDGPTEEALDLMIIYQGDEPNIMYSYYLPGGFPRRRSRLPQPAEPNAHRRRLQGADSRGSIGVLARRRQQAVFGWKLAGFTRCSKSCAGGLQTSLFHCVRSVSNSRVQESLCNPASRPAPRQRVCNLQPCPPRWVPGDWIKCSKTCGRGVEIRNLRCKQIVDENGTQKDKMLPIRSCPQWSRPQVTRPCNNAPCPKPSRWNPGRWGECSVTCGSGIQSRNIDCVDAQTNVTINSRLCRVNSKAPKPAAARRCNRGSCKTYWFTSSSWSKCSAECGQGKEHRLVFCGRGGGDSLPESSCKAKKPSETRSCNRPQCQATWVTSEWNKCSVECGKGVQTRTVFCAGKVGGMYQEYPVDACPRAKKPKNTRECGNENCPPQWFTSGWKECSRTCGGGSQTRDVICMNYKGQKVGGCENDSRPAYIERCNTSSCPGTKIKRHKNTNCKDRSSTLCAIVIRASFCKYRRYANMCCKSCSST